MSKTDGASETLAIPKSMRVEVDERDRGFCRVCGRYVGSERRALHHIEYGGDAAGMGGRRLHSPDNLITVGWLFEHDCHSIVHASKRLWIPLLQRTIKTPGATALQLYRWDRSRA